MKRFFLKMFLFSSPFLWLLGIELFVLPIDFFTFRVWEALLIKEFHSILPGHFYPRMVIEKVETGGDLTHDSSYAIPKRVKWITDRFGYRKRDSEGIKPKIVIIGDSNILSSRLTQEEMLSEVLEERLKVPVYPYAPVGSINTFLKDLRFIKDPPEVVILSSIEREILNMPLPKFPKRRQRFLTFYEWRDRIKQTEWVQAIGIFLDRLIKMNMLHSFRVRIGNRPDRHFYHTPTKFGMMFFLQGEKANQEVSIERLEKSVQTIEAYNQVLRRRGIRFIFLPIPNKETIYYEYLPQSKKPIFLEQLIRNLRKRDIEVVDTQKAFEDAYQNNGTLLYFLDDSHWNERAVQLAADLTVNSILKKR